MRARSYGRAIRSDAAFSLLALAGLCSLCGCSLPAEPTGDYAYERLATPYRAVRLKTGTTLDVLAQLDSPAARMKPDVVAVQLLTQSDTSAALSAKSTDKNKIWVNLIAFDEYRMTARRKYFFFRDERPAPSEFGVQPPAGSMADALTFDAQFVIDPEIGTTNYATDEAKRTAIVRSLAERFKGDVGKLSGRPDGTSQTDEIVTTAGLMMNQVFQGVLLELDKSSALARNLNTQDGVAFGHMSLGEGRIRLLVADGIGTVAIRIHQPMPPLPAHE